MGSSKENRQTKHYLRLSYPTNITSPPLFNSKSIPSSLSSSMSRPMLIDVPVSEIAVSLVASVHAELAFDLVDDADFLAVVLVEESMSLLMPRSNPVPQSIIITLHSRSNSRSSHISSSKRSRVVLVRIEVGSSVSREGRRSSNSSRVSVNGSVEDLLVSVLLGVEGSSSSDLGGFDCSESASGGSVVEGGVVGSVVVVVVVVKVGRDGVVVVGLRVRAVVIVNMRGVVGVRVLRVIFSVSESGGGSREVSLLGRSGHVSESILAVRSIPDEGVLIDVSVSTELGNIVVRVGVGPVDLGIAVGFRSSSRGPGRVRVLDGRLFRGAAS
ncbi:hypothetical protein BDY24DRAFT_389579 [Mrakia frigida]|uniref:uncharacterized protein n=1 Tax=Mrakia frigida TaxID=29902 RepID=UPI003FCC09C9